MTQIPPRAGRIGSMKAKTISAAVWGLVAILFFIFGVWNLVYGEPYTGICFVAVGGVNLAWASYTFWKAA